MRVFNSIMRAAFAARSPRKPEAPHKLAVTIDWGAPDAQELERIKAHNLENPLEPLNETEESENDDAK